MNADLFEQVSLYDLLHFLYVTSMNTKYGDLRSKITRFFPALTELHAIFHSYFSIGLRLRCI